MPLGKLQPLPKFSISGVRAIFDLIYAKVSGNGGKREREREIKRNRGKKEALTVFADFRFFQILVRLG